MITTTKQKILIVAGARPNFPKIAPLMRAFAGHKKQFTVRLVHTGQHYDFQMSDVFFHDLGIPEPDIYLNIGSGSHAAQTAAVMTAFEKVVLQEQPHLIIVVGDVNSTVACSLVAAKMHIKIAHVEAGLRSGDRAMPEEINRIVTDSLSDYLFVTETSGVRNLNKEGVPPHKVHYVGNVMIDTLIHSLPKVNKCRILKELALNKQNYAVLTLHRPSNVDAKAALAEIHAILADITQKIDIIYPIHPRTRKMIARHGFKKDFEQMPGLKLIDPLGYIEFIALVKNARFVLTDSGGIQEETAVLGVPCLTMRENTERPSTLKAGNKLVGRDGKKIGASVNRILSGKWPMGAAPELWDGKTAQRVVSEIKVTDTFKGL